MLETPPPPEHRPAGVAVLGELREDAAEIDLAVAERAEPAGALEPWLEAAVDALPAGRIELGVFHMERDDALVIPIDEVEIVETLQHEMRGIVIDAAARMIVESVEQHLERGAVEHVLAGMQLEADVDTLRVAIVEDRLPASGELARDLVAVGLARGRLVEIEEPRVPGRDLDALVAERRGPAREARERIERWRVRGELGEKDRRAFDRLHGMVTLGRSLRGLQRGACP